MFNFESDSNEIYLTDIKYNGFLLYLFHSVYSIIRYYSSYENLFFLIISLCQIIMYDDFRSFVPLSIFTFIALIQHMMQNKDRIKEQLKINSRNFHITHNECIKLKDIKFNMEFSLNIHKDIPADCEIIDGKLIVNEYNLTGEKLDVIKQNGDIIYRGTEIVDGNALVKVIRLGNLCKIYNMNYEIKKSKTQIEKYLDSLCIKNLYILIFLTIITNIILYLKYSVIKILEIILLFNTLIPLSLQFFLNYSSQIISKRIEKKFNLKINPHGIKTFQFNPKYIVTDKTGTITLNKIELDNIYSENNFNKICENIMACTTIDLHSETKEIIKSDQLEELLIKYLYENNFVLIENNIKNNKNENEIGNFIIKINNIVHNYHRHYYKNLIYEYGVKLSIISYSDKYYMHIQGMPEAIHKYLNDNIHHTFHNKILEIESNHNLQNYYLRIISHASKEITKKDLEQILENINNIHLFLKNFNDWSIYVFKDYIIDGLKNTIKSMKDSDITMLTGDKFSSSLNVGQLINLIGKEYMHIEDENIKNLETNDKPILINGNTLEKIILNSSELFKIFINTTNKRIIYRASPSIKQLYVSALQNIFKEDVMMIGDGANDLSALMSSNIGVGVVGENSTVQSVSDIVIDNWNVIPYLIQEFDKMKNISLNLSRFVLFKHIVTAFTLCGFLIISNFQMLRDPFGPYLMAFFNSIIFIICMIYVRYTEPIKIYKKTNDAFIYKYGIICGLLIGYILFC